MNATATATATHFDRMEARIIECRTHYFQVHLSMGYPTYDYCEFLIANWSIYLKYHK